jgi:uncharacterized damage-inducible protein DinB
MTPSRAELLDALKETRGEVLDGLRKIPAEEFEKGRYENGWNARQILAHMASVEWTYPRLIDIARGVEPKKKPDKPKSSDSTGGILSYNDRQVAKREGLSVDELLEEFESNREETIRAVENVEEELLTKEVQSAGGLVGPLTQVMHFVAVDHVRGHLQDILQEFT